MMKLWMKMAKICFHPEKKIIFFHYFFIHRAARVCRLGDCFGDISSDKMFSMSCKSFGSLTTEPSTHNHRKKIFSCIWMVEQKSSDEFPHNKNKSFSSLSLSFSLEFILFSIYWRLFHALIFAVIVAF